MKQQPDTAHLVTLFYYSASIALETWLKTSSTGSSESTWGKQDDHKLCTVYTTECVFAPPKHSCHAHLPDDATALVEGDDWLGRFVIQVQTLLDGLLIVIRAAAGLATLQKPLDHGL